MADLVNPDNPFETQLKEQGIELSIPPRFLDAPIQGIKRDRLTNLPLEDSLMRMDTVQNFSKTVKNKSKWVFILADLDNLKAANEFSRKFGDLMILWSASSLTHTLDRLNLPPSCTIRALKQIGAADETIIWAMGLNDEIIELLKHHINLLGEREIKVEQENQTVNFTLSNSVSLISHDDPEIQLMLHTTQKKLASGEVKQAFDLYEKIKTIADYRANEVKVEKDLRKIPLIELNSSQGVGRVMEVYDYHFGNTRVKGKTEAAKNTIIALIASGNLPKELPETIEEWVLLFREQFGTNDVLDKYFT